MTNCPMTDISQYEDINTIDQYQVALRAGCTREEALEACYLHSRDNARTPMQWTPGPEGGFTSGTPWLKVNGNHVTINAETEENDPDSVLNWFRTLMAYRNGSDVLKQGRFRLISREKDWIKIERRLGDERVIVAVNWSPRPVKLPLVGYPVLSTHGTKELDCELQPWEAVLIEEK